MFSRKLINMLNSRPHRIDFAVTYRCNARCSMCNIWRIYEEAPEKMENELNLSEYKKIVSGLPSSIASVQLTGGEPFLREDLPKIIALLCDKNIQDIYLPTNGLHHRQIACSLEELISDKRWRRSSTKLSISVSIDGFPMMHNQIRGVKNAYEEAMRTYGLIKNFGDSRIESTISITISQSNLIFLPEFLDFLVFKRINFGGQLAQSLPFYNLRDKNNILINKEQSLEFFLNKVYPYFVKEHKFSINNLYWIFARQFVKNPQNMLLPCATLKTLYAFDPYGNLLPCLMWPLKLASLRECHYSFSEIIHKNRIKIEQFKRLIYGNKCPNCWTPCVSTQTLGFNIAKHPLKTLAKLIIATSSK